MNFERVSIGWGTAYNGKCLISKAIPSMNGLYLPHPIPHLQALGYRFIQGDECYELWRYELKFAIYDPQEHQLYLDLNQTQATSLMSYLCASAQGLVD